MTDINPFLLIMVLVFAVVLIIGNLYFIAHYSHHADNGLGSSKVLKLIILVAYLNAEC